MAAMACPTRAAAVAREGDSDVLPWEDGFGRMHDPSELVERGFAVDVVGVAVEGASQNARVGMRAT